MLSPHLYELLVQVAHLRTLVNLQLPRSIQRIQQKFKNIVIIPLYHDDNHDFKDTGHSYIERHLQQNILYICYNLLNLEQSITYFCKITNNSLQV